MDVKGGVEKVLALALVISVPPSIRIYLYFIRNCARKYGIRIWIFVT